MKVTAIMGSPRKRGLTDLATRRFLDNLAWAGDVHSEIVFLSDVEL